MKARNLLTWALLPFLVSCTSIMSIQLPEFENEISFYEGTDQYFPNGSLKRCRLSDTITIQGYTCINWLHINENGYLRQCEIAVPMQKSGYTIPIGSVIFFYDQVPLKEHLINFSQHILINNIECTGGGKVETAFHENDSLKCCFPRHDTVIQGYPCKSSLLKPVYFYPNGLIKSLTLYEDIQRNGVTYHKGDTIEITETGEIRIVD